MLINRLVLGNLPVSIQADIVDLVLPVFCFFYRRIGNGLLIDNAVFSFFLCQNFY